MGTFLPPPATSCVLKCRYVSVNARADEEKDGWSYARLRWKKKNEMSTFIRSTSKLPLAGSQHRKKIKGFSKCAKTLRRVRQLLALMGKLISDGSRKRRSVRKEGWEIKMSSNRGLQTLAGVATAANSSGV